MESTYWRRFMAKRASRRRVLGTTLGLGAAALGLAACDGDDGGDGGGVADLARQLEEQGGIPYGWQLPDETDQAVPGGIYRTYYTNDITGGFDPYRTSSRSSTLFVAEIVYESLLTVRSGPGIDPLDYSRYELQGELASEWETPDALTVVFKMRPNVYFHNIPPVNGRAMDIDDWRASLQYLDGSPYRSSTAMVNIYDMAKVEFPSRDTMVLHANEPYAPGLGLFSVAMQSFYVVPKEGVEGRFDLATQPIGTSYRQLESYQPSVHLLFKKHDRYWREGRPFIDRWHYPIIPEKANRLAQFIAGNIYAYEPLPEDLVQVQRDVAGRAVVQRGDYSGLMWMAFFGLKDFESSPWRDERVRQALSMVIDRETRYRFLRNADELEAAGLPIKMRYHTHFHALSPYWLDWRDGSLGEASKYFRYDPAEAKRLMEAAGYGSGIDIDVYSHTGPNYGAQYGTACDVFADMLQKSGLFRVNHRKIPYSEYLTLVYQTRNFTGLAAPQPLITAGGDVAHDLIIYNFYHSASLGPEGGNFRSIRDARADELVMEQRRNLDQDQRVSLNHELQRLLAEKMYCIPVDGVADTFSFRYPWVRNTAWPAWNEWLAEDTPNRDSL